MISTPKKNIGKNVEVYANNTIYRGVLKSVTENEVYIKSSLKTWAIPAMNVTKIKVLEEKLSSSLNINPLQLTESEQTDIKDEKKSD